MRAAVAMLAGLLLGAPQATADDVRDFGGIGGSPCGLMVSFGKPQRQTRDTLSQYVLGFWTGMNMGLLAHDGRTRHIMPNESDALFERIEQRCARNPTKLLMILASEMYLDLPVVPRGARR